MFMHQTLPQNLALIVRMCTPHQGALSYIVDCAMRTATRPSFAIRKNLYKNKIFSFTIL